jgi:RNA polymerase sigma-70 factor (family 1)
MTYKVLHDQELLCFMKEHDHNAFQEIYQRYWKSVFQIAYKKVRCKEVAEELTQNLFLSLWEKRTVNSIQNLDSWLFGSIKYGIINYYKSQLVHEKYVNYVQGSSEGYAYSTEQLTLLRDLSEATEKGIALLPQKTQQVFKLSRIENRTVKEISQVLNISEKAVEYHITQSLKLLRVHLRNYLVFTIILGALNFLFS